MKNLENTEKWSKLKLLYGAAIDTNIFLEFVLLIFVLYSSKSNEFGK